MDLLIGGFFGILYASITTIIAIFIDKTIKESDACDFIFAFAVTVAIALIPVLINFGLSWDFVMSAYFSQMAVSILGMAIVASIEYPL